MKIAALVLAAGASRRMGRNKMLLRLEGAALVRRAAGRALGAGLSPVIVVLGYEADRARAEVVDLPVTVVINPDFEGPVTSSLHRALDHLAADVEAAVVVLADMVLVTEPMLSALAARVRVTGAPAVASRYGDVIAPPLAFRRELFGELRQWEGVGAGRGVVDRHAARAVFVDWAPGVMDDLDTPEDFRRLQRAVQQRRGTS